MKMVLDKHLKTYSHNGGILYCSKTYVALWNAIRLSKYTVHSILASLFDRTSKLYLTVLYLLIVTFVMDKYINTGLGYIYI